MLYQTARLEVRRMECPSARDKAMGQPMIMTFDIDHRRSNGLTLMGFGGQRADLRSIQVFPKISNYKIF